MMIRSTVGKHRIWTSVLAVTFGLTLIIVACQTSTPQGEDLAGSAAGLTASEGVDQIEYREWLGAAVEAGEFTSEEARAMWAEKYGTRERTAEAGERGAGIRERIGQAKTVLAAMVEAGEITQEQADRRMQGLLARVRSGEGTAPTDAQMRERLGAYRAELARAVEAGEMTSEEAGEKWEGALARLRGGGR